jgi:iron(III) transport system substrate-binding protein
VKARSFGTSIDLPVAEKIPSHSRQFPGITTRRAHRAERVFQRIGQNMRRIYAVDVVNSSDAAHFIVWKRDGLLAPCSRGRGAVLSTRA